MAEVIFEDNTIKLIDAMEDAINAGLEEAAGELESQVKRNQTRGRDTKNSWQHRVDDAKHVAYVGNPRENAIWEEFGTGEYALEGKGRRGGYWVYVEGSPSPSSKGSKTYTLEEAKRVVAMMRSKGLEAHYTKGKRPVRALFNAINSKKDKLIAIITRHMKGGMT